MRADSLPEKYPEVCQCCHYLVLSPEDPNILFQQNHCGVYGSVDGGDQWESLTKGLPQGDAYIAIYREALHTDARDPAGVYFATTTGTAYYSRDEGDIWEVFSDTIPPVYYISTAVVK